MKLNGMERAESDDQISFSYSDDEDFLPKGMIVQRKKKTQADKKVTQEFRKPTPKTVQMSQNCSPPVNLEEAAPRRFDKKKEDALNREQKRRRLSSMNVPRTPTLPVSRLVIREPQLVGKARPKIQQLHSPPETARNDSKAHSHSSNAASVDQQPLSDLSSSSESESELMSSKPRAQLSGAAAGFSAPSAQSQSSPAHKHSLEVSEGEKSENEKNAALFHLQQQNGYFSVSSSSGSESSDSESWEPDSHWKKTAKQKRKPIKVKEKALKSFTAEQKKKVHKKQKWMREIELDSVSSAPDSKQEKARTGNHNLPTVKQEKDDSGSEESDTCVKKQNMATNAKQERQEAVSECNSFPGKPEAYSSTRLGKKVSKKHSELESDSDSDGLEEVVVRKDKQARNEGAGRRRLLQDSDLESRSSEEDDFPSQLQSRKAGKREVKSSEEKKRSQDSAAVSRAEISGKKSSLDVAQKSLEGSTQHAKPDDKASSKSIAKSASISGSQLAARHDKETHNLPKKTSKEQPSTHRQTNHAQKTEGHQPPRPVERNNHSHKDEPRKRPPADAAESSPKKLRLVDIDFTGGKVKSFPPKPLLHKRPKLASHTPLKHHHALSLHRHAQREEKNRTEHSSEKRIVSSSATNVLKASPLLSRSSNSSSSHVGSHTTFPGKLRDTENSRAPPLTLHHPPMGKSTGLEPKCDARTDIFQKELILAHKFPQKRKLLSEHSSSSREIPSKHPRTADLNDRTHSMSRTVQKPSLPPHL